MADTHQLPSKDLIPSPSFQALNAQAELRAKACKSAPMPSLSHLSLADYNFVYEPSDDTFLLLDAICYEFELDQQDTALLRERKLHRLSSVRCTLEIGCGTGVATVYLAKLIMDQRRAHNISTAENGNISTAHHVTDINPDAIRITIDTARANQIPLLERSSSYIVPHLCDLATPLVLMDDRQHSTLNSTVDVLLFNPPYVPTPDHEVGRSTGIEASWAGGTHGRRVIDRTLPQIASLLAKPQGNEARRPRALCGDLRGDD